MKSARIVLIGFPVFYDPSEYQVFNTLVLPAVSSADGFRINSTFAGKKNA
jgi:hypothetical protein